MDQLAQNQDLVLEQVRTLCYYCTKKTGLVNKMHLTMHFVLQFYVIV